MFQHVFPLVTVGLVVFNRDWIVGQMLDSLLNQTYPRNRVYLIVVDGGSKDRTVEVVKEKIENSGLAGFKIMVTKCNIPEARNIVVKESMGDIIVFWDSDEIWTKDSLKKLIEPLVEGEADITTLDNFYRTTISCPSEIDAEIEKFYEGKLERFMKVGGKFRFVMGHTAIKKSVFEKVIFDPDLTWAEDVDFFFRALSYGFKILPVNQGSSLDINLEGGNSDIVNASPLSWCWRGLWKKAKLRVTVSLINSQTMHSFFKQNPRYLFYIGYPPIFLISIYGFFIKNLIFLISFPCYLSFYIMWKLKKGATMKKAFRALLRSILLGTPLSYGYLYYFIIESVLRRGKYNMLKPK
ncbi:MAG: glycosyltransferase [Candidatus Bathyarchaeia archaeon]